MKTLFKTFRSILQFFGLDVKLKKIYNETSYPKVKKVKNFINLIKTYILGAIFYYNCSANTIFEKDNDKKVFYNLIKQKKYDFSKLLVSQGFNLLHYYLEKHKHHKKYDSWSSDNILTLVIDKMECPRTSGNHEKSKKLYKSKNGHYLINLALVVGDNKELFDLNSVLYDPDCNKTSIEVALEMLQEVITFIKTHNIEMNRIRFSADREFLTKEVVNFCKDENLSFITRAKNNTVFIDGDFKFNTRWLKGFLFHICFEDFRMSTQLNSWSDKHKKPRYKYWSKVFQSNYGAVKVVAVIESEKEITLKNFNRAIQILLCFNINMTAIQIIECYRGQRWQVEVFHKSWKRDIEVVKSYIGLSFIGLKNHYIFRALSYLYLAKYRYDKGSWKGTIGQNKKKFANKQ